MSIGLDKLATNHQLLLSLPFREATGIITRDEAKPGHQDIDLVGFPTWVSLATGLGALDFDGAADYLECAAANCGDLNFTSEDYSITCWVYKETSIHSNIVIGRYGVDLDGWEVYMNDSDPINKYLDLRHHHNSLTPDVRDGCYSTGWIILTWWFLGITRSGLYPKHYRNGLNLEVTYETGGLKDPDTCNRDLVIGTRFTKDANFFPGMLYDPRAWLGELSPSQMMCLFDMDKHWFGVN